MFKSQIYQIVLLNLVWNPQETANVQEILIVGVHVLTV